MGESGRPRCLWVGQSPQAFETPDRASDNWVEAVALEFSNREFCSWRWQSPITMAYILILSVSGYNEELGTRELRKRK